MTHRMPRHGFFVLIDRQTHQTVAAGMIDYALRRASNVHRQAVTVDKAARARLNGHAGRCLWFTGLSGSGKSTVANALERKLHAKGYRTYILDGDNVRLGLNHDLGFTDADRVENIRRIAELAKLTVDAGLIVMTAFISPFRAERQMARELFEEGEFVEILSIRHWTSPKNGTRRGSTRKPDEGNCQILPGSIVPMRHRRRQRFGCGRMEG